MKAEEREYRYRLFTTPRVTCGPEVAEFITAQSGGVIQVEFAGEISVIWQGNPPYEIDDIELSAPADPVITADLKIILEDKILTRDPIQLRDYMAVVSRRGYKMGLVDGPDVPIFAYLVLAAIGLYEHAPNIPNQVIHEMLNQLPNSWASRMNEGVLLWPLPDSLQATRESTPSVDNHISAIERVLAVIADKYPNIHAKSTARPDPRQQAPDETASSGGASKKGTPVTDDSPSTGNVFVSYSHEDRERVIPLIVALRKRGLSVEWELNIPPGMSFDDVIESALTASQCVIAVWSANSIKSHWVKTEAGEAKQRDKLLPVLIDDVTPPLEFRMIQTTDLVDWEPGVPNEEFDRMIEAIESKVGRSLPPPTEETPTPDSPTPRETASTGFFGFDSDSEAPNDALDYGGYAKALATTICDSATGMPFTIGICAPWGRGKTALMKFIKDEINVINAKLKGVKNRSEQDQQRAEVIDFNAWRYSKSNAVWAAFLGVIVKGIEDSLGFWKKISFRLFVTRKAHPLRLVGWIAGVIVFGFILYGKVPTIIDHFTSDQTVQGDQLRQIITVVEDNPPNDTTATLYVKEPKTENDSLIDFESIGVKNAMTVVTGLITVISTIWGWFWPLSRGVLGKVKKGGRDILPQAQEDVIQYLSIVSQWLALQTKPTEESEDQPPTSSLSTDRFVVFIDDIDRVQPGKVLLLMEAIKLFMDTERFVFILAMDTRVVRFAIGEHYKFMCKTVKDREEMGRFYLEKMIQVPFHLPALTAVKRRQLIDSVISKYVVEEMSEPEPVPVSETIDLPAKPAPYVAEPTAEPIAETAAPPSAERPAPARKAAPSPEAELSDEIDQPGPIEAVRMKITPTEYSVINNIMDTDGFNISPRLMKRFINIYMMARHILIMERAGQVGTGTGYVPPSSFAKWLAISVLHPFESAALVRWLSGRGWESPFATTGIDPNLVFDDKGEFCYQVKKKPSKTAERGTLNQKPFDDLSIRELHRFGRLLLQLDLDWIAVSRNIHITNCFNLVLE